MKTFHKIISVPYVIGISLLIFCMLFLSGCEEVPIETMENVTPSITSVNMEYSDFDLTVDKKTNIVYINNEVCGYDEYGWKHVYHVYTPYYSKNGKICKYVDGKVVEIE